MTYTELLRAYADALDREAEKQKAIEAQAAGAESGCVRLPADFLEWEWFDDDMMVRAFVYLLLHANTVDRLQGERIIPAGSLKTTKKILAADLGMSEAMVRRIQASLESSGHITQTAACRCIIIGIKDWHKYTPAVSDRA